MNKWIRRTLLVLGGALVIAQFFRIDQTNPKFDPEQDFIWLSKPSAKIKGIMKLACYDCHSYETNYPWYANIAPVSWLVGHDIDEGREHLNFSTWGEYSKKKQAHKLEECAEEVASGEMPMPLYTLTHPKAKLTDEERETLIQWFEQQHFRVASHP